MGSDRKNWGPSAPWKPTVVDVEYKKRPTRDTPYQKLHSQIQSLRIKVTRKRLNQRQQRVALREQRQKTVDYEVKFHEDLQRSSGERGNVKGIDLKRCLEGLCEARDKLGPMEEEYNEVEDDLDVLEYRLENQEKEFYALSGILESVGSPRSSIYSSSPERTQQESMSYSVWDAAEDSLPKTRYLSRLGDANILRERLEDLIEEQMEYVELEEQRRSYSILPYPPNITFMANFPLVYTQLVEELRQVENHVRQLKDEAGIVDSYDGQETAPTTPSSTKSASPDPGALFATAKRLQQAAPDERTGFEADLASDRLQSLETNGVMRDVIPLMDSCRPTSTPSRQRKCLMRNKGYLRLHLSVSISGYSISCVVQDLSRHDIRLLWMTSSWMIANGGHTLSGAGRWTKLEVLYGFLPRKCFHFRVFRKGRNTWCRCLREPGLKSCHKDIEVGLRLSNQSDQVCLLRAILIRFPAR